MNHVPDQDKLKAANAALRDRFFAYLREQGHTVEENLPHFSLDGWDLVVSSIYRRAYILPGLQVTSHSRYFRPRTFPRKSIDLFSEADFPKVRKLLLKFIERGKEASFRDKEAHAEAHAEETRKRETKSRLQEKALGLQAVLRVNGGLASARVQPDAKGTSRVTITLDEKDIEILTHLLGSSG